ncbi:hypothetical protein [Desertihabitans aurantiacus]|uniref:hypothetical protein n=1 Tax=Desertihabitans aurantiacus TaxID=2282477 RepID=UPI000DF8095E|nr:hypothetical protein [Desertihabitans aurantiacus]
MVLSRFWTPDSELPPLTRAAADRFRALLADELGSRGRRAVIKRGVARTDRGSYRVENLARVVAGRPRREWRTALAGHLDALDGLSDPDLALVDLATVLPRLRRSATRPRELHRVVTGDLHCVFVLDGPDRVTQPEAGELLLASGASQDDIDQQALINLASHLAGEPPERSEVGTTTTGHPVQVLRGASTFVASAALLPVSEGWLGPDPSGRGHLVMVPNGHLLLSTPFAVEPHNLVPALEKMVELSADGHDGEAPIGPDVFWVRGGRWDQLGDGDVTDSARGR